MQTTIIDNDQTQVLSLDEWLKNPPESSEWVEGKLIIAEIISPTDSAEDVFKKVNEYLQSRGQEIWLVLPESK